MHDLLEAELEAVLESSFDEIYITDGRGVTLRVNAACERLYGLTEQEMVGRTVAELAAAGVFTNPVTPRVLQSRSRETVVQETRTGRRLIVTATPILDGDGNVTRVVSVSRDITDLNRLVERLAEIEELAQRYRAELAALRAERAPADVPVGRSPAMERVLALAARAAPVDATVLLSGEPGVGKEQVARYIHHLSPRSGGPFLRLDCGAAPAGLLEAELFGAERGALPEGLREGRRGLLEVADGGTLFLDEVADLPPTLQARLLRFLQEGAAFRVGGARPVSADVRIIAATRQDLPALAGARAFRADLYYRLAVVPIHIPPLRERPEDVLALAGVFLERLGRRYGRTRALSAGAAALLCRYAWPGNVRELETVIERAVVTGAGPFISPDDLPDTIAAHQEPAAGRAVTVHRVIPLAAATAELERQLLDLARGQTRTTYDMARLLGVNQSTAARKLRRHFPDDPRRPGPHPS